MRLLLVEDSPRLRDALRAALAGAGFTIDAAADGETALAFLDAYDYPLLLLDLGLPKLDGMAVLARLRGGHEPTRVLVLSARDQLADRIAALATGAGVAVVLLTVKVTEALFPSLVAVSVDVPAERARTKPVAVTPPTRGLDEGYETAPSVRMAPAESRSTTVSCAESPTVREVLGTVSAIEATGRIVGCTVTLARPLVPSTVALIDVEPALSPFTRPSTDTAAVSGSPEL